MRILILGGSGMLGHQLWKQLHSEHEVWVTLRRPVADYARYGLFDANRSISGFDAANQDHLVRAFQTARPEAVVNCIASIKQANGTEDPVGDLLMNSILPHRLDHLAGVGGLRLIHMSTDAVFDGRKGNYSEAITPCPDSTYGRCKLLGEPRSKHSVVIRSSIIGHSLEGDSGLLDWFLNQQGGSVKGYSRALYSGLTTLEMASVMELILTRHFDLHGVWHVSSAPISKLALLQLAKKQYGWEGEIIPDESLVIDLTLNSERFRSETGYSVPGWETMISELARERHYRN
jgi:dTDP-4-dehydrorhamnose reductase